MCQSPTGEDINKCKVLIHNEITVKTWGKQLFPFGTVYQRRKEKKDTKGGTKELHHSSNYSLWQSTLFMMLLEKQWSKTFMSHTNIYIMQLKIGYLSS